MGWYAGQDGARRLRAESSLRKASARFCDAVTENDKNVQILNYTDKIQENRNFETVKMYLHLPMTQEELLHDIHSKADAEDVATKPLAIAIPYSHYLQSLDGLSDAICQRLSGLFIFGAENLKKDSVMRLVQRCPNLSCVTIADMEAFDYSDSPEDDFWLQVFQQGLLPELRFLELAGACDETIRHMVSAPLLRQLVFRFPAEDISNEGFIDLVEAGGAKELMIVQAGHLTTHKSKSLTSKCLAAILPKLANKGKVDTSFFLRNMIAGRKYHPIPKGKRVQLIQQQKKNNDGKATLVTAGTKRPFAVVN